MEETLRELPKEEALRYMGCRGPVPPELEAVVDRCAALLLDAVRPRWLYDVSPLSWTGGGPVLARWGIPLGGADIRRHLAGCGRAAIFCATLSLEADRLIQRLELEDMTQGLAADCCATAAVEALCDRAQETILRAYPGCGFPFRFSPGYGDLPLELQGPLLSALEAGKRIGVHCNESHLLIPRKSVTAILGIGDRPAEGGGVSELPSPCGGRNGCEACGMKDRCPYRRKEHP